MIRSVLFSVCCAAIVCLPGQLMASGEPVEQPERSWPPYFLEHQKYFEPKTYKMGDAPVWSINNPEDWAANSIVIEGDEGLIVYDTGMSRPHGEAIMKEIRKFSDKPVVAIFYSHHHPDHYNGTDAIVSREDVKAGKVKIYAWDNFEEELASEWGATAPIQVLRVGMYTGALLEPEDRHHHGCCGKKYGGASGYIPPTDTFAEDTELNIAGVKIKVFYTGGEAISEFGIYLPEYKTMAVADEIYPAHPNMYTIRGAKMRVADGYLRAYDTVLAFDDVQHLLGSHLPPISGRENIQKIVTRYRDLVQYVHDQAVRQINKGQGIPELRESFDEVPQWLQMEPYNTEMYGTMEHNAPSYFAGYMGWFNGDPTDHKPTPLKEAAARYLKLMGGRDRVVDEARKSLQEGDAQWAAELLVSVIRVDQDDMEARNLKAAALRTLGYRELNTTWRSWYLTAAREYDKSLNMQELSAAFAPLVFPNPANVSLRSIFENYRYRVDAEKVAGGEITLAIDVETDEDLTLKLRNGVLIVQDGVAADADVVLLASRENLNSVLRGEQTWEEAGFESSGDSALALGFWEYFDNDIFAKNVSVR